MTQAEKTMLRYQYVLANTTDAQGDFARTANTWANQIRILKQQFEQLASVIGGALINAFKPFVQALNNVMAKVISFAETVINALGMIFGWQYQASESTGVTDDWSSDMEDYADATDDAASSAKDLKTQLLGIDELNVLDTDDDSSSGSGSGTGTDSASSGGLSGKVVETDALWEQYTSSIDSLYKLGEYIGDTLSRMMESIDWEATYQKARDWGTGLANFLNGLISPRLFYNLGSTVANSINTGLQAANAFAITLDWENLGESLASGVTGFFENWDAGLTAETLSNFAFGILEAAKSAVEKLKDDETFNTIGQKLVDFVCGIDWFGLTWDLVDFFAAFVDALVEFPIDFTEGIGQRIVDKIFGEDSGITIEVPDWIKKISKNNLENAFPALGLTSDLKNLADIGTRIKDAFSQIDLDEVESKISGFFEDNIQPWFTTEKWLEIFNGIKEAAITKWDEIVGLWDEHVVTWWDEHVAPWFTIDKWIEITNGIKDGFSTTWGNTVGQWKTNLTNWWNKNVAPWFTIKKWEELLGSIPTAFTTAFKAAGNNAISMLNNVISGVETMVNRAVDALNALIEAANKLIEITGYSFPTLSHVTLPKIPAFETGGITLSHMFAEIGEGNKAEAILPLTDNRAMSMIADSIMDNYNGVGGVDSSQIENAVYNAMVRAQAENTYEASLFEELIDAVREGRSITIDGRELVEIYDRRKSRNGWQFSTT